jgi:hypothetical protein
MVAAMAGVMDEPHGRPDLIAKRAGELDDRRHRCLLVLFAAGRLHPGERIEDVQAGSQLAADRLELGLPAGVVELDTRVRGEYQAPAEKLDDVKRFDSGVVLLTYLPAS